MPVPIGDKEMADAETSAHRSRPDLPTQLGPVKSISTSDKPTSSANMTEKSPPLPPPEEDVKHEPDDDILT